MPLVLSRIINANDIIKRASNKDGRRLVFFLGAFHLTQNSGNFGWYIKGNVPFRFGSTGIFGTSFEGDPL